VFLFWTCPSDHNYVILILFVSNPPLNVRLELIFGNFWLLLKFARVK
jgi:hypothetical protein